MPALLVSRFRALHSHQFKDPIVPVFDCGHYPVPRSSRILCRSQGSLSTDFSPTVITKMAENWHSKSGQNRARVWTGNNKKGKDVSPSLHRKREREREQKKKKKRKKVGILAQGRRRANHVNDTYSAFTLADDSVAYKDGMSRRSTSAAQYNEGSLRYDAEGVELRVLVITRLVPLFSSHVIVTSDVIPLCTHSPDEQHGSRQYFRPCCIRKPLSHCWFYCWLFQILHTPQRAREINILEFIKSFIGVYYYWLF